MSVRHRIVRNGTALVAGLAMLGTTVVAAPAAATEPPVGAWSASDRIDQVPRDGEGRPIDCAKENYQGGQTVNGGAAGSGTEGLLAKQTFTPSIGNVSAIELCLTPIIGGRTVGSLIRDNAPYEDLFTFEVVVRMEGDPSTEGEVTRTSATFSLSDQEDDLAQDNAAAFRVVLPDANLTAGKPYVIELVDPSITFVWRLTCGGDVVGAPECTDAVDHYEPGESGADPRADHGFATFYDQQANLVGSLSAPGLVCPGFGSVADLNAAVGNVGQVSVAGFDVALDFVDGEQRTQLGTTHVAGLAPGGSVVLTPAEFGVTEAAWTAAADVAAGSRRAGFTFRIDTGDDVPEASESDNVAEAGTTLIPCGPSELANPAITAGDGTGPAIVEHGVTWFSYDDLTASEIAAGATGFSTQSTATTTADGDGTLASPAYGSPAYGSPAYGSPAYGSPAYGSPAYGSPAYGSPAYGSPAYGSPAYGSPAYGSPAYGSPAYGSPAYGSPAYGSPAYGSPGYAGNLAVLFASIEHITKQVPLVAAPVSPGWEERLEEHKAAHPPAAARVDEILALPSQDRTLHDVLGLDPPLLVDLNDVDFSRVLNLTMLSVSLANQRLADFDWSRVPGVSGPCDAIAQTSHLTCDALVTPDQADPVQTTLMQLQMHGYDMGSFPAAIGQPLDTLLAAARARTADGTSGNLLFDVYLANTGFRDLVADFGYELPTSGHFRTQYTPLGHLPVTAAFTNPDAVVDCGEIACDAGTSVADVEAAYAFDEDTTVADLVDALSAEGSAAFELAEAVIGLHSLNNLPWALFDRDPLDLVDLTQRTGQACPTIDLRMGAEVTTAVPVVDPTLTLNLADGWDLAALSLVVDGAAVPGGATVLPSPLGEGNGDRTTLDIAIDAIVEDRLDLTATVCASATLGTWTHHLEGVAWERFRSVDDLTLETKVAVPADDTRSASAEVVEQTEPDEGSAAGGRLLEPNGIVTRHITGPDDVDEFVIPIGQDLGNGLVLEEGDFIHVVMAPPAHEMGLDRDGNVAPVGNHDFDMALFVGGPSPIVDTLFGPHPDPAHGAEPTEEPILPLTSPEGTIGDPYGHLAASPAYGSPAYGSPAYGSPAYGSPAYGSPAYGSPAYGSDRAYVSPARVISNQRGDAIEHVFTEILPGWGQDNEIRIQVAGHLGAASVEPYSLWFYVFKADGIVASECPAPYTAQEFADALEPAESIPALQPGVESVILYNEDLYALEYGRFAADQLGGAFETFAEVAPGVNGVVVDPMDDPDYRALMTAWMTSADWCDPLAANRLHGAMRSLVMLLADQTVGPDGTTSLQYVVVVGGDDKHPFARLKDDTTVAHELEHYASIYNQAGLWSPLTAAHAEGYYLSDNPMVTRNPRPWSDEFIWLPDFVSSRLYGSPDELTAQMGDFNGSGGVVAVDSALVTGEDFLADGAEDAVAVLEAHGVAVDQALLHAIGTPEGELTTAADLEAALGRDPGLSLLFQHADQSHLQSAHGTAKATPDPVTADDVAAQQSGLGFGTVVAGTVCHFGEDIPAAFRGRQGLGTWPSTLTTLPDKATSYLLAHTSYGYGISEGVDLSEELVNLATELAATGMSWGEATVEAKRHFFLTRSDYGSHQRKTIMTLTGSGMPWVTTVMPGAPADGGSGGFSTQALFTAQATTPGTGGTFDVPVHTPTVVVDPISGLDVATLDVPFLGGVRPEGCTGCYVRRDVAADPANGVDSGTWFEAHDDDAFGGAEGTEGRPIVPKTTTLVDVGDRVIGGVIVTGMTSETQRDAAGNPILVDFAYGTTKVSSNVTQAGVQALDVATKGPFANVRMDDEIAYITLPRASARGEVVGSDGEVRGTMRLDKGIDATIVFRDPDAPEYQRPAMRDLDVLRTTDQATGRSRLGVTILAEDQSRMVRGVVGLLIGDEWLFAEMGRGQASTFTNGEGQTHHRQVFTTGFDVAADAPDPSSVAIYIVDEWGSVGFTERKGQALTSVDGDAVLGDPELLVDGEVVADWYVDEALVTIRGEEGRLYRVSIDGRVEYVWGGAVRTVTGSGYHEVRAVRVNASPNGQGELPVESVVRFGIDDADPEVYLLSPHETAPVADRTYVAGALVDVTKLCRDAGSGIATCSVDPANTIDGQGRFLDTSRITGSSGAVVTARAVDVTGRIATKSVTYHVVSAYAFGAFEEPVRAVIDPLTGRTRYVVDANPGRTVPFKFTFLTRGGVPIGDLGLLRFTWEPVQAAAGVTGCAATSDPHYRYSSGRHRFNAVVGCPGRAFAAGELWRFVVTAPDGLRHTALVTVL